MSDLQEMVKRFEDAAMFQVDDALWMGKQTLDSLLAQLDVSTLQKPFAPMESLSLDALKGVRIYIDETLPFGSVESGTYKRNPRVPVGYEKIVRHRYTI